MTASSARLALAIAERLLDPDAVGDGLDPGARGTLSGLAGTALLHARLSALDERFATAAIEHWNRAATYARGATGNGTFSGPGSVAASLILGAPYLPDPPRLHEQCGAAARWLAAHAVAIAEEHHDLLQAGMPPASWAVYDAICGLSGIGRVLLAALDQGHGHARAGLDSALRTLTALVNSRAGSRPGWWLPADAYPAATPVHASGAAATGTAHGIAGPLSLLAIALDAGYGVPGQDTAIRTAADWLMRWRVPATDTWPPLVSGYELDHDIHAPVRGRHDAWCYGTPGISSALTQAAGAIGDDEYRAAARHAMTTLAARDASDWDVEGPTLCHGHAGILQASRGYPELARQAAALIESASEPRHRYLIQYVEHGATDDDPGLLIGAAGVALALADHAGLPSAAESRSCWDSVLLLS
jgi:hypothetical protein